MAPRTSCDTYVMFANKMLWYSLNSGHRNVKVKWPRSLQARF